MIMRYQFYPWTQRDLAKEINEKLGLPVDAPRRIADGTMQRLEKWIASPADHPVDLGRGQKALGKIQAALDRGIARRQAAQNAEPEESDWD